MIEFIFSFAILLASVIAMAIGIIKGRDPIAGSCGGLKSLNGDAACQFCGKRENCARK